MKKQTALQAPLWFLLTDAGDVNFVFPLFRLLEKKGIRFHVYADGKAANNVLQRMSFPFDGIVSLDDVHIQAPPKVVVSSLSKHGSALKSIPILKKLGATTMGIQTNFGSYTTLWADAEKPEYIFTIDESISPGDIMQHWQGFPYDNILSFGSPELEAAMKIDLAATKQRVLAAFNLSPPSKIITYFGEKDYSGLVAQQIAHALNDINFDGQFVLRPHPAMSAGLFPSEQYDWDFALKLMRRGKYDVSVFNARLSTHDLIAASDVTLGVYSTTLLLCAAIQTQNNNNISILLPGSGWDWFQQSSGGVFSDPPLVTLRASKKVTAVKELGDSILLGLDNKLGLESFPTSGASRKIVAKIVELIG